MKHKLFAVAGGVLSTLVSLAQDTSVTIDDTTAGLETAFTDWADAFAPVLYAVVGAVLGFYVLKLGIRIIKGVISAAK